MPPLQRIRGDETGSESEEEEETPEEATKRSIATAIAGRLILERAAEAAIMYAVSGAAASVAREGGASEGRPCHTHRSRMVLFNRGRGKSYVTDRDTRSSTPSVE